MDSRGCSRSRASTRGHPYKNYRKIVRHYVPWSIRCKNILPPYRSRLPRVAVSTKQALAPSPPHSVKPRMPRSQFFNQSTEYRKRHPPETGYKPIHFSLCRCRYAALVAPHCKLFHHRDKRPFPSAKRANASLGSSGCFLRCSRRMRTNAADAPTAIAKIGSATLHSERETR